MKNLRKLVKNQRGQGFTEYILLLAVVVGIIVAFKKPIGDAIDKAMGKTNSAIESFDGSR